jgi:uncharacterized protein (DUF1778 family)
MKRENRIEILLTDAERAVVANAAAQSGLTLSSYVRMAMMLAEAVDAKARTNLVDRAAIAALNMIGSNINQIARVANESKTMTPDQIRALSGAYKKLQHIVRQIEAPAKAAAQ